MTSLRKALAPRLKPLIRRHSAMVGSIVAVRTEQPHVVLSYDDGPEPGGTEQVLQALAERGWTATFFVLVSRARLYPHLLDQTVAAGHEIALHGLTHERLTTLPPAEVLRRCRDGKHELEDLVGRPVRWLRPPYGRQSPATWAAVRRAGMDAVVWGPTSWDSRTATTEERLAKALTGLRAGDILLGHDGFADARDGIDDGPPPLVNRYALGRELLAGIAAKGLEGVSLEVALASGTPFRAAWFKR